MRSRLLAAGLLTLALPAQADSVTGVILAFDRQADILVLEDKTIYELSADTLIPADLAAGDTVTVDYESAGEDGITKISSLTKN